jgi:hypothetical protein
MLEQKIYLMIPIFFLYDIKDIKEINFDSEGSEYLKDGYTLNQRKSIHEALKWTKENPNFDFKGIMKDAPVPHKLKFSNKEVFKYLMDFKAFMENEEYELLTDDRPPKKPEDFL